MVSKWVVCSHPRSDPKLRLLCFPHAGGSARVFYDWAKLLPSTIEVCAIELPGRGRRLFETPFSNIDLLLTVLGPELLSFLDIPFACFGHSLGARIAFESCRWLHEMAQLTPQHFWVAAARAPHLPPNRPPIHALPDSDFIFELRQYSGTPDDVLNNSEIMALMLPALRADFSLLETYKYRPSNQFNFPITCFWGQQDDIAPQLDVAAWQQYTNAFSLESVSGGHFFPHESMFPQRLLSGLMKFDCVESSN